MGSTNPTGTPQPPTASTTYGASIPPTHTGVIATTCPACRCRPSQRCHMCTHALGAPNPHWRTVHPILGVLTHITDPCLCSFTLVFVFATSYTFDTTKLCPHDSTTLQAPRPTPQRFVTIGLVVPRLVCIWADVIGSHGWQSPEWFAAKVYAL